MSLAGLSVALRRLRATRLRIVCALLATALTIASGVTFGSWTVSGTGSGYSKARTAQSVSVQDASASTTAQLYPGGSGDLVVKVTNPNPFAITITSVSSSAGAITSDKGAACNAATGVSLTNGTGLSQSVAAGATVTFNLANQVSMSNASDNSCQGAIFTIPITVSATS